MKSIVSLLLFFSIILMTACGSSSTNEVGNSPSNSDTQFEKVKLLLASKGNPMFYAYIARDKGFFQEEGLDVELVPEKGGANVVQQIGTGAADFGIVAVASLIPAWEKEMDIVVVYQINSTNLFDLVVPKYSDITNINQLKGQAIGVTELSGAEVPMVQSLLAREGLHASEDVTLLPIGNDASTILTAFEKGEITAYSGGAHDLVALYAKGFQSKTLTPRSFKSLPSTAIIASGKIIKERPDLVEKISRGIARGIDFSIKDRNSAFEMMKNAVPEEYTDERVGQLGLITFIDLSTPIETEKGYGYIYRESWKNLIELFSEGKQPVLTKEIDVTKYLNTSFLEKANEFEK